MTTAEPIRLLIVDDHTVVRDGLVAILAGREDMEVVAEAKNGVEAIEKAAQHSPDVILLDLRMPVMDGVEAMRLIREKDGHVQFLVLTTFDSDEQIFQAIEAGARGYLLKDASRTELFEAIRAVHRGESLIQPGVAARVLDRFAQLSRQASPPDALSERELDVLRLMAKGSANKEIAFALTISENTVKTHVSSIFQKLAVNDRTEAVTTAIQRRIIQV